MRIAGAAALVVVALAGCSSAVPGSGSAAPLPDTAFPTPLAEYQYFPGEDGFLRSISGIETPRSDADMVRLAQASCRAIMEQHAKASDLRPGITGWAAVDNAAADKILTAASANLCESAVLVND